MYYTMEIEKTKEFKKFLVMKPEEFDKYMCETYPNQFNQRKLSMSETCMCWGFCIGKGWYYYLDQLCNKLDLIQKTTGIKVSWSQIKEKFASGRFYNNIHFGCPLIFKPSKYKIINTINFTLTDFINNIYRVFCGLSKKDIHLWSNMIQELISNCESFVGNICEETGEYIEKPIDAGSWIYPLSEKGFLKVHPDRKEVLKQWKEYEEEKEKINDSILKLDDKGIKKLKKFLKII